MTRTKVLQEIRRMRFVEAYVGWQARRVPGAGPWMARSAERRFEPARDGG